MEDSFKKKEEMYSTLKQKIFLTIRPHSMLKRTSFLTHKSTVCTFSDMEHDDFKQNRNDEVAVTKVEELKVVENPKFSVIFIFLLP